MKAVAVFPNHHKLELVDHPAPGELASHQARLQIIDVGICGTDREIATFEYGKPPQGFDYLILGHESLARVIEIGRSVSTVKPGDLVIPNVRRPCAELCEACVAGRQDFCYTGQYRERGIVSEHGFLTEEVIEDAANLNLVPDHLIDVAVLAEPLTVTEKAFDQICAIQARLPWFSCRSLDQRPLLALILGAGPVGLLAAMKFRAHGYQVWVYSRGSENDKPPIAAEMGVRFIDAETVTPADLNALAPQGIDVIYEAMGAANVAFEILAQLGRNGIFVFTGIPRRSQALPLDTSALLYNLVLKNQVVLGTVNAAPSHFESAIRDIERFHTLFPTALRKLISARYPIEQFEQPFFHAAGIKNVISP